MSEKLSIVAIIPLYNGAKWIEQTIQSVLDQTLQPNEFIVVDDGSTDNGPEIVEKLAQKHPIKLLRKSNGGQSSARNFGVANSKSDLIALLDNDDFWYSNHLEELIKPFNDKHHINLGWSYSNLDAISNDGKLLERNFLDYFDAQHPKQRLITLLSQDMMIFPSMTLISRKAFQHVGGFDTRLSGYEDDDLFIHIFISNYRNVYIEKSLGCYRRHDKNTTHTPKMAISRMIYARKLANEFPNDEKNHLYYIRDCITPRFLLTTIAALKRNETFPLAITHLKEMIPHLTWTKRLALKMALPLIEIRALTPIIIFFGKHAYKLIHRT